MQLLGHIITAVAATIITLFLVLVVIVIFKINDQIMKK